MNKITGLQIKKIHILKSKIGLSDFEYSGMLDSYKVTTSKDLDSIKAYQLIGALETIAIAKGVWNNQKNPKSASMRYSNLSGRPGMASPKQIRHLEALFVSVSRQDTLKAKQDAFKSFLKKRFNIFKIEWITEEHVSKIRNALNHMIKREENKGDL